MGQFSSENIAKTVEDYSRLMNRLTNVCEVMRECHFPDFKIGQTWVVSWWADEIEGLDPINKTITVKFATYGAFDGQPTARRTCSVKIPIVWLQMEDPKEEILFHMELGEK